MAKKIITVITFLFASATQQPDALAQDAAQILPEPEPSNVLRSPSLYFSWYAQAEAGASWNTATANTGCSRTSGAPAMHALRIVAMSGNELILDCPNIDKAAQDAALAEFEAEEQEYAQHSRAGFETGSRHFSSYSMMLSLLKHASDVFTDQAWLAMTKEEITQAQRQGSLQAAPGYDWVFPPAALQERNPDIAAEELMEDFRQEVYTRAASVPATFIMHSLVGNLKYDREAGAMQFGTASGTDPDFRFKSPLNIKHNGLLIYSLDANDGMLTRDQVHVTTAGLRTLAGTGYKPGLIPDRSFAIPAFSLPQEQAERLLNRMNMLVVNTVITITGAEVGRPQGLGLTATEAVLFGKVENVFVTDLTGILLATYDVSQLSLQANDPGQNPVATQSPRAAAFCSSYEKRFADATTRGNTRLLETLQTSYEEFGCQ